MEPETRSAIPNIPSSSRAPGQLAIPEAPPPLIQSSYPDTRFWTRSEWTKYVAAKAEKGRTVHKLGFITDANGKMVSDERLGVMSKFSRTNWAELYYERLDPKHWSSKTKSTSDFFLTWMAIQFKEFRLCDASWKAEAFATARYPDWKATKDSGTLLHMFLHILSGLH